MPTERDSTFNIIVLTDKMLLQTRYALVHYYNWNRN